MEKNNLFRKTCFILAFMILLNSSFNVEAFSKSSLKDTVQNQIRQEISEEGSKVLQNQKIISKEQKTYSENQEEIYSSNIFELPESFIFDDYEGRYEYSPTEENGVNKYNLIQSNIKSIEESYESYDGKFVEDDDYKNFIELISRYNSFSELKENEIEFICRYALVNSDTMDKLDKAGKSLVEAFAYANIEYTYNIEIEEVLKSCITVEQCNKLYNELGIYKALLELYKVDQYDELCKYIMSGYKAKDVLTAYIINNEYNIDIETLLSKDIIYNEQTYNYIAKADKKDYEEFSADFGINKNVLMEYASTNELKFKDFEQEIENYIQGESDENVQASTGTTGDEYLPEKQVGAPYSFDYSQNEAINLNSGGLVYEVTDQILKGRNGLDLVIARRYESDNANIYNPQGAIGYESNYEYYVYFTRKAYFYRPGIGGGRWSYYDDNNVYIAGPFGTISNAQRFFNMLEDEVIIDFDGTGSDLILRPYLLSIESVFAGYDEYSYSYAAPNKYLDNMYGLGTGWSFAFSSIEDSKYLHLSNGNTYIIQLTDTQGDSNFKDYTKTDIRIEKESGYTNGKVSSQYTLYYKDGKKEYFSADGKLIGIKDKFDNEIKFVHTTISGRPKIEITDTIGRIITIASTSIDSTKNLTVVTLPEGQLKYTISKQGDIESLTKFENQLNHATNYSYNISSGGFNVFYKSTNGATNKYANLSTITHPTGYQTAYTYEQYVKNLGSSGLETAYRIKTREDKLGTEQKNKKSYMYSANNISGYPAYGNSDSLPDTFSYSTTVRTEFTGVEKTSIFNNKHLLIKEETKLDNKLIESADIQYDTYKLPIKIDAKKYNISGDFMRAVTLMENDEKGNVIASWTPLAGGNKDNTEYKTSYVYDKSYNILLSKTYKQDYKTGIIISNKLSNQNKTIESSEIIINGAVKEKQAFEYDAYGNITSIKKYKDNFVSFEQTQHTYSQGAYLSQSKTSGIENADGSFAKQSPGETAGTITDKYFEYDNMGRVKKSVDANGNATLYQYDSLGGLTKQINPDGTTLEYIRNYTNNYIDVKNENNMWMRYEYTADGHEYATYISENNRNSYAVMSKKYYDALNRLVKESNTTTGADTIYEYNKLSELVTKRILQNAAILAEEKYEYEEAYGSEKLRRIKSTILGETDAPSIVTTQYINNVGQVVKTGKLYVGVEYFDTFTYDYVGNRLTEKTAYAEARNLPYSSKWEYDYAGRQIKSYDANGEFTTYIYDSLGNKIASIDCEGNTVSYKYDGLGRLIEEVMPIEQGHNQISRYFYDAMGNIIKATISNNKKGEVYTERKTEYEYNNRGRLEYVIMYNDASIDSVTKYVYDGVGNQLSVQAGMSGKQNNDGQITQYTYDALNREKSVIKPVNLKEIYNYKGIYGQLESKTDPNGNITSYEYDGLDRIKKLSVRTSDGKVQSNEYEYTKTGQKKSEKNDSISLYYKYDSLGRLESIREVEEKAIGTIKYETKKTYTYDIGDNKRSFKSQINNVSYINDASYDYDNMSRLIKVYEKGVLEASYSYNRAGRIEKIEYSNSTSENYTYNKAGWIAKQENKSEKYSGKIIGSYEYSYYADGNQATSTNMQIRSEALGYETKTIEYKYDTTGRLKEEKENSGIGISYEYDRFGNRKKAIKKDGKYLVDEITYEYSDANKLIKSTRKNYDEEEVTKYSYDLNGNQIQKVKEIVYSNPIGPMSTEYNVDKADEYDIVDIYEYDGFNRITKSIVGRKRIYGKPDPMPWDPNEPIIPRDPLKPNSMNAMDTGELLDKSSIYEKGGSVSAYAVRIVKEIIEGKIQTYSYRPDGLRNTVEGEDNAVIHVWENENIVGEIDSKQGNTSYIRGTNLIMSSDKDNIKKYYHHDGQRDIIMLTDSQGTVSNRYSYDAFGNEVGITYGNDKNPFRYKGEYYDIATGTYYLRARYYNPVTGRMLTEDSVRSVSQKLANGKELVNPRSLNLYTYCYNNPIMYTDPSGNIAITTLILLGSIVIGTITGGYTAYQSYEQTGKIDWESTIISGLSGFMLSYTIGMSGYELYYNYCLYNGTKPFNFPKSAEQATQTTQHGEQRLAERGFTESDISLTKSTNIIKTQVDGAKVYIKEVSSGKFNVIVEGNRGIVTALKNISQKSLERLSNNYGWK